MSSGFINLRDVASCRKAEQMRLEIFERKILRKIFGPCKDDQTREWRKQHNQELQNLFQIKKKSQSGD